MALALYHNNNAVCAQKVRLVLAAKKISVTEHHMLLRNGDVHTPEYLRLNPNGVVPTLVHDERPIIESTVICEYLEETFPTPSLTPRDPYQRAQMRLITRLPDVGIHRACGLTCVAIAWRHQMLAAGGAQLANRPDKDDSNAGLRSVVQDGLESPHFVSAVKQFVGLIDTLATRLADGRQWLAGDHYSLAEACILPYVVRLEDLSYDWLWQQRYPLVSAWLARCKAQASFSGINNYRDADYQALTLKHGQQATDRVRSILGMTH